PAGGALLLCQKGRDLAGCAGAPAQALTTLEYGVDLVWIGAAGVAARQPFQTISAINVEPHIGWTWSADAERADRWPCRPQSSSASAKAPAIRPCSFADRPTCVATTRH